MGTTNAELKEELLKRGFYVIEISQSGEIDYLVVSTAPPAIVDHKTS